MTTVPCFPSAGCRKCVKEHENVHRGQWGPGQTSEYEAEQAPYGKGKQCLQIC